MPFGEDVTDEWAWVVHVPTPILVLDASGVVASNEAAATAFGLSIEKMAGYGLLERVPMIQQDGVRGACAAALARRDSDPPIEPLIIELAGVDGAKSTFLDCSFGVVRDSRVVVSVADATDFFHVMMMLAFSANTTMVLDEAAQILWGPVGRYAAQEMDSPWYGRGEANPLAWLHPEDIGRVLDAFQHVLAHPGMVYEITVRTRHVILEDDWGTALIRAINLIDDPLIGGVLIQTHAEGENQTISLGRTTGSFQSIAEVAPIGIILSNHLGHPLYWNSVARALFDLGPIDRSEGATDADVDWPSLADPDHVEALRRLLDGAMGGVQGSVTAAFDLPTGRLWISVTVAPQVNGVGEPMGWLATLQDVTHEREIQHELQAAQERLIHLAGHDSLTGLANRRLFAAQLGRAVARSGRDQQRVALLFCDLDSFKPVNDSRGHDTGDLVLVEIGARLVAGIRTNDLAARLGGDEFVVLVEGFENRDELEVIASRLVASVAEPIKVIAGSAVLHDAGEQFANAAEMPVPQDATDDGDPVSLGISIGIAVAKPGDSADSLLSRADDLMYQAKAAGKGRYILEPGP